MFGWLAKKGQDARVYMCVKEMKMALGAASDVRRAKILAMASLLRGQLFSGAGLPREAIDHPMGQPSDQLMQIYEMLEEMRNHNTREILLTKKRLAQFGMSLPAAAEEHAKNTGFGVEVWMATVAPGIVAERSDDVLKIWELLRGSRARLDEALEGILHTEAQTMSMLGQERGPLANIDRSEWLELCDYEPSQFAPEPA